MPDEISKELKAELVKQFQVYANEIMQSDLSSTTKDVYISNAEYFVRWILGDVRAGLFGSRGRASSKPFKPRS